MDYTGIFLRLQPPRRWMFVQKVDIQELLKSSYTILATFLWVDQLTIARIRGSQSILSNSDNGEERLEGFVPVIEDWHTKMCFMEVTWFLDYTRCA